MVNQTSLYNKSIILQQSKREKSERNVEYNKPCNAERKTEHSVQIVVRVVA